MKIALASFFLFIFSFQVLPVKELGRFLFKGTMTEEIHQSATDIDENGKQAKNGKEAFSPGKEYAFQNQLLILTGNGLGTLYPANVPKQHIPDIVTPPPNIG